MSRCESGGGTGVGNRMPKFDLVEHVPHFFPVMRFLSKNHREKATFVEKDLLKHTMFFSSLALPLQYYRTMNNDDNNTVKIII